jgi:hypothetical protein
VALLVVVLQTATAIMPSPARTLSHRFPRPTANCRSLAARALIPSKQPLDEEELEALAGVWHTELALDDGGRQVSLFLDALGRVQATEERYGEGPGSSGWEALAVPGSTVVSLSLQLGVLFLEGTGERKPGGLRCASFRGSVLEGRDDPCVVGKFVMTFTMPTTEDTAALEQRHRSRVEARPAPPLSFKLAGFVGRWRMLLSMDDSDVPAFFTLELLDDHTFSSSGGDYTGQTLAGSWGLYSQVGRDDGHGEWKAFEPHGSSLWLRVERSKSTETLRGVADLPDVRADFNLWGRPVLDPMQELAARTEAGAVIQSVDGAVWIGAVERAYIGRFSLMRAAADDADAFGV